MASIEKRSENTYRITVSCGYNPEGKKLFKKKTVTIEPMLAERQKEKKLNELAVLFEKEVKYEKSLDETERCFKQFLQMSGYDAIQLNAQQLHTLMTGTQHYISLRMEEGVSNGIY